MDYGIRLELTAVWSLHLFCMFKVSYHDFEPILEDQLMYEQSLHRYIILHDIQYGLILVILQNHLAERHWVEVNSRVNYPLKTALVWMQQNNIIDLDDPVTKFCVSLMTGILSQIGIQLHVRSWNNHRIPGKYLNH